MEKNGLPVTPSSPVYDGMREKVANVDVNRSEGEFATELPSWENEVATLPNIPNSSNKKGSSI